MTKKTEPRSVGVICDCAEQAEAVRETLHYGGFRVVRSISVADAAAPGWALAEVQAWVACMPEDPARAADLRGNLCKASVGVHVENEPGTFFGEAYISWQQQLLSGLTDALSRTGPETSRSAVGGETHTAGNPAHVWVLASSLGGPPAVKSFLDALEPGLPAAFVYAQHVDAGQQASLVRVLARHSGYVMEMAESGAFLQQGVVTMLPVESRYAIDSSGILQDLREPWAGPYSPCLDQVITTAALAFQSNAGVVVFSGMGDDGSSGCLDMQDRGGRVWAQEASGCSCSSMPDAVRKVCSDVYSDTPEAMARSLSALLGGSQDRQDNRTRTE